MATGAMATARWRRLLRRAHPVQPGRTSPPVAPSASAVRSEVDEQVEPRPSAAHRVPPEVLALLGALPESSLVVTVAGEVLHASDGAVRLGLVPGGRMAPRLNLVVAQASAGDGRADQEIELSRRSPVRTPISLRVRVTRLSPALLLVLVEDLSESQRLDAVRRDFVANVSHELKTPVGALALLAEAIQSASDEPDSVRHFAARMQVEAVRLTGLVNDLIDLSRLQDHDPLAHADVVAVDRVVAEATDSVRLAAAAKDIRIVVGGSVGLHVLGEESQLVTALRNLMVNAVAYSPPGTRVGVAARAVSDTVEISVTDQGIGIPERELGRIFERFYRVDQARSRVTGGTGLGLSIVKHVCANHGGEVTVWSVEGEGSTFTLRLPLLPLAATGAAPGGPWGVLDRQADTLHLKG